MGAAIILPDPPTIIVGTDVRAELEAAAAQVQSATEEAYANRSRIGESLFADFIRFHDAFHAWKARLGTFELTLGSSGAWTQARSYRLQAIEWRKTIATKAGRPLADPSTNVVAPPERYGWVPWVLGGAVLALVLWQGSRLLGAGADLAKTGAGVIKG